MLLTDASEKLERPLRMLYNANGTVNGGFLAHVGNTQPQGIRCVRPF